MIVLGKNVVVSIFDGTGFKLYGCASNCSLSISTSMVETSSVGTGIYTTFKPQRHNITGTISGLVNLDDPNVLNIYSLRQLQLAFTLIQVKFTRTDDAGNDYVSEFDAYITNSTDSGETNGAASFDIDLQVSGEIVESSSTVVRICNQTWMTRNWDGTTFRNGDTIPEVTDNLTWASLTTPAWCYYENDPANGAIYGKLYNWYAVNDSRGFAPFGWRVPDEDDIDDLSTCLGGDGVAGGKMKQTGTTLWSAPNTGATNESGFTSLPAGGREGSIGNFYDINLNARFWTNVDQISTAKWYINSYNNDDLGLFGNSKSFGFPVRFIKEI